MICKESEQTKADETFVKKTQVETDRSKALEIRNLAMESHSESNKRKGDDQESTSSSRKSRRTSSDTIEFLKHKLEAENERQREKMDLQRAQQTQFSNVLQQMQQQNAQMQQQNTQIQQQFMALMQQQQEQFRMLFENKK